MVGNEVAAKVKAISVDTTGSASVAVYNTGTPLLLLPVFEKNPNAMIVLWKERTGVGEAAEINAYAEKFDINYLQFAGGIYSSEWFWAKMLHVHRVDDVVRQNMYCFVKYCDWIPFVLTDGT